MKFSTISLALSLTAPAVFPLCAQPAPPQPPPMFTFWGGGAMSGSFLGVGVAEISSERAHALNLREEYGVEITHVDQDSPAEKAGLRSGDVVQQYNGQRVEGIEQFQRMVHETPAGRVVKLEIVRNGSNQTLTATIGARKPKVFSTLKDLESPGIVEIPEIHLPDIPQISTTWRTAILGVEAESLGPQLAEYFGVKEGVLVRAVVKGSAADKAGIKAGDVITKVDQTTVASAGELSSAIHSAHSRKSFPVQIMRDHREMSINVMIDEDRSEHRLGAPANAARVNER